MTGATEPDRPAGGGRLDEAAQIIVSTCATDAGCVHWLLVVDDLEVAQGSAASHLEGHAAAAAVLDEAEQAPRERPEGSRYEVAVRRIAGVTSWNEVAAPQGGTWMARPVADATNVEVIAPPGVVLTPTEALDDLRQWRAARWPLDEQGWIAGRLATVRALSTAQVLLLLPPRHHAWVEDIMRRLVAQTESLATPAGGLPDVQQSAASRLLELREELRVAFPGKLWYE